MCTRSRSLHNISVSAVLPEKGFPNSRICKGISFASCINSLSIFLESDFNLFSEDNNGKSELIGSNISTSYSKMGLGCVFITGTFPFLLKTLALLSCILYKG